MTKSEEYISFIVDQLRSGNVEYVKVSAQFCTRFHKTQRTFASYWKQANEAYRIEAQEREKQKLDEYIKRHENDVKTIINTKIKRLEILQTQIDACLKELEDGTTEDVMTVNGSVKKVSRKHSVQETQLIRRTLRDLQSEISKIEGDYAPTQQKIEVVKEQPLFPEK